MALRWFPVAFNRFLRGKTAFEVDLDVQRDAPLSTVV